MTFDQHVVTKWFGAQALELGDGQPIDWHPRHAARSESPRRYKHFDAVHDLLIPRRPVQLRSAFDNHGRDTFGGEIYERRCNSRPFLGGFVHLEACAHGLQGGRVVFEGRH
jgi:hypothetical protein